MCLAASLLLLAACGGTEPRVPTTLTLDRTSLSFTALGQEQQLSPSVADQDGNALPDEAVSWSSSAPAVAEVSQTGLVTARSPGSATITASAGAANAAAAVTVAQTPAEVQKVTGDAQNGLAGATLPGVLVVQVNDALGHPVAGAAVNFSIAAGGGSVSSSTRTTTPDGRASTTFTIGTAAGLPQSVLASAAVAPAVSTTFTATALAGPSSFQIEIEYLNPATPTQQQAFEAARLAWQDAVFGDVEDGLLQSAAGDCGVSSLPAVDRIVDDVLIFVILEPIDGSGGILGGAGPCYIRDPGDLTVMGLMRFDTDDLEALETDGFLSDVIKHEMGHVLGFGTLWPLQELLEGPTEAPISGTDPHFIGSQARQAFDLVGGSTYSTGLKVPVENTGGPGTADSHWRESVFGTELMTGFINANTNPLSIVTLASLADQGYLVNLARADTYSLIEALRAFGTKPQLLLKDDVLNLRVRRVNRHGRVTGELPR